MTKKEYLSELESHLVSISDEERINALQFYEEYFEDAGPENEQQVISELGKPFTLAKSIICEQSAYSKSRSYSNYKASISINLDKAAPQSNTANSEQPHTQYTAYNYTDSVKEYTSENTEEKYGQPKNDSYSKYDQYKESYTAPEHENDKYDTSYKSGSRQVHNHQADVVSLILFILVIVFIIAPILLVLVAVAFAMIIGSICCIIATIVCVIRSFFTSQMYFLGLTLLLAGLAMMFAPIGFLLATKLIPKIVKYTFGKLDKLSGGAL